MCVDGRREAHGAGGLACTKSEGTQCALVQVAGQVVGETQMQPTQRAGKEFQGESEGMLGQAGCPAVENNPDQVLRDLCGS